MGVQVVEIKDIGILLSELNIPNKIEYPIENPYHNRNFRVDFYIKYNN